VETFKCPYCGKSHPDTTIFCVQKQRALVRYPTTLLVTLALLAFAAVLVTAFTQPVGLDDGKSFLATVFIYKPWLFYSFVGILLLVWEGSFLRSRPFQRWTMWIVTVIALLIVGLVTARPDIITAIQKSQGLKDFFTNPWLYIIANLLFVLFWLYQTVRRRMRRDKSKPLPTLFSDSDAPEEENAAIAETEYTSGDLLAGAIIFLFSSFVFPFLYLVIARYALTEIPLEQQQSGGNTPTDLTWIFTHFSEMTSLRISNNIHSATAGVSLALLDLAIAALLFAISTVSLLIVTYSEGLQEIQAVDTTPASTGTTGKLPTLTPRSSIALPSVKDLANADPGESLSSVLSTPSFSSTSDADDTTQEDVELAVGETVARTALAGLQRALISLSLVASSAALSIRNLLWPFAVFVGAGFTAAMSGVVYDYLHYPSKFPFSNWTTFIGDTSSWTKFIDDDSLVSSLVKWLLSWGEIAVWGLIALALITIAIALFTRTRAVLPDALSFLRYFGLLAILTYWIFAAALGALNAAYGLQEFVSTHDPSSFFYIKNPWPLEFDFTAILSFVLFLLLAVPQLTAARRKQPRKAVPVTVREVKPAGASTASATTEAAALPADETKSSR
jgi:hypothetical protein